MNKTVKEDIYNALNELLVKELKEFKWRLNYINYDERPNIPRASLEKADAQDVVDLLIQHYGEDALKVCIDVLQKCNRNDLAKILEEKEVADADVCQLPVSSLVADADVCQLPVSSLVADADVCQLPVSSDYRNYIKQKFATIKDPNAIPGEYVPLIKRYSKLIILDYHPSEEEKEHEILAMGRKHLEIISKKAKSSASIETLFNPDKYGLMPQVVVLQGAAGIGKTMMAKKIMFDWASQQIYQDKFNYVFYISCSEMNFHAESQKISIAEIISNGWLKCHKVKNVIQNILNNEDKLLFIIDGFDELRYSFDQPEDSFCIDPWKKEPVRILLSSLFQKKLLPKSSLIITTRPMALEKFHQCLEHSRYFQILGFSTKEREEYFNNFFDNKDQAMQAFIYVKQNDTLFTMCVIPLVSWIICTVMKQEIERGKDLQKTSYTLTAIYMLYLTSLLKFHHKESKQCVQGNIRGLCSLAAEGIWKEQILFMEEEVKKHSLYQRDYLALFLNQSVFKRDIDCIQTFSFIHLSFQEFFAALFYILKGEEDSQNWNNNLQTLLECHKSFRHDFAVGFRFLFGFLNEEKRMRQLKKEFGWEISPKNKEFLLDWVKNKIDKRINFRRQKEILAYLYETQDDNFVNNALCGVTEIDYRCNSDMELMILAYCIQYCQNLKKLFIKSPTFPYREEEKLFLSKTEEWSLDERYIEDFFKALTKLRNLTYLRLAEWPFTESCSRHLAEVFKKNQRLKKLRLSLKDSDDRAAELLCEGLQHADCKVDTLVLAKKAINESCSRHLAEVLSKNQRLRTLGLSLRNPDEKPMEMLCRGLKQPECTIETLELDIDTLTESCSRHLAEVLGKNQRLRVLYLSLNNPDDKPMEVLCTGLKNPECKIERLRLGGMILTESCSRNLAEVLWKNQRLRMLHLFLNNTDDKIMELLCDGLSHPECKIQTIQVDLKTLTESSSRHLADVLRKNQKLTVLYLFLKNPDDKTIELLCEGLKHPECTIQRLELDIHSLTESCSWHLAEVLRKNHSLRELYLSLEGAKDRTMELLCDGLKHPECTIKMLHLTGGIITIPSSRHLADVLRKNQRLNVLLLYLNNEDDKAMEVLCEGLKHPECTIKTLQLAGEILTESCSRNLAEVLKKNQSLRVLMLSLNNPDDKIMEVLCDGLKQPECTIETLNLTGGIITTPSIRHLAEVLRKNQRLNVLLLDLNDEDDKVMEVLCEGLKHPECTIKTLKLAGEILTECCSRNLAEVLKKNQSLRELTLSLNNPDDKIIEVLCYGLKQPECTIETLNLTGGIITIPSSRHLAEVLRKNQRFIVLFLYLNNEDDKAMEVLCEGLKHPECTIKTLQLAGEILTECCSRNLAEVLKKKQRLKTLYLLLNNTDDKIIELLCDGLSHPECKIETIEVDGKTLTESCSKHLADVLRKNQKLTVLYLCLNNPDDKTMELLCKGLKHLECTIQTLKLTIQSLTESCSWHLAGVLSKNHSLRVLCLTLEGANDRTMELLCDGLKHPECTIKMLQLYGKFLTESCSRYLAELFRKNWRLREVFLSLKNQDDKIIEVLRKGLKHPQCNIETLELNGKYIIRYGEWMDMSHIAKTSM